MLPSDWARPEAQRKLALPRQRRDLIERFTGAIDSRQLGTILDYTAELSADRVYIESPYVDFDYRSEYSNLYARSFNPPPDKCERLLFFRGEEFLGFLVARPSPKPVGRSAIAPPPKAEPFVCCRATHEVRPYGQRYQVDAWPFMSQDGVYGRCAHAAVWAIARYHHLRHNAHHASISAVVAASGTAGAPDKTSPSHGLYLPEVMEAFAGLGLPTLPYSPAAYREDRQFIDIVCRYLNSGFPVALSTPKHLTVLIGYGYDEGEIFFIRSDDNSGAYERIAPWDGSEGETRDRWDMLLVPLPARIHVRGEIAENRARLALREQGGATEETAEIVHQLDAGELRFRTYAVESSRYKEKLAARNLEDEVVLHHQLTPCSGWVWVTEFQLRTVPGPQRVVAEVAIDATSHPKDPRPILANLPGRVVSWLPDAADPVAKEVPAGGLYASALPLRGEPIVAAPSSAPATSLS